MAKMVIDSLGPACDPFKIAWRNNDFIFKVSIRQKKWLWPLKNSGGPSRAILFKVPIAAI